MGALAIGAETDLEALAEAERQTSLRVNERTNHHRGWALSPNIERASPSRERKEPQRPVALAVVPPSLAKPPSPIGRLFGTYHEFVDVCRDRADELEIPRSEIDRISGLSDGHSAHLLAKQFIKIFTPASLGLVLDTLGLRLRVEEDPELTARTLRRRKRRDRSHAHYPPQFPAINGAINGRLNYGYPPLFDRPRPQGSQTFEQI